MAIKKEEVVAESTLNFKNKSSVVTEAKKYLNSNFSKFKKELISTISDDSVKFSDSQVKAGKLDIDAKAKTILLTFPITRMSTVVLNENFEVVKFK